jgi:LAO/AO transport system kinase
MVSSTEASRPRRSGSGDDLLKRFFDGDSRALARVITLVENEASGYRDLLSALYHRTGKARKIGITGSTGAGKSTLVDELAKLLVNQGSALGIIAVDPTSPFTGGALLGDRVRMQDLGVQKGVFIRSMASRGSLGGLAKATREVSMVLDAFGKDFLLIESVGVGQVTLDIAEVVDTTVVILVPESGDGIQAMKAGLMEIADIFVVNKADRDGADRMGIELETVLNLKRKQDDWNYPVVKTEARKGLGVELLLDHIRRHGEHLSQTGHLKRRKEDLLRAEILQLLSEKVQEDIERRLVQAGDFEDIIADILRGNLDPYRAADQLLEQAKGAET